MDYCNSVLYGESSSTRPPVPSSSAGETVSGVAYKSHLIAGDVFRIPFYLSPPSVRRRSEKSVRLPLRTCEPRRSTGSLLTQSEGVVLPGGHGLPGLRARRTCPPPRPSVRSPDHRRCRPSAGTPARRPAGPPACRLWPSLWTELSRRLMLLTATHKTRLTAPRATRRPLAAMRSPLLISDY